MVPIIDNVGHAGGAVAGVIVSFFHRPLLRNARRPLARVLGTCAVVVIVVCAVSCRPRYTRGEAIETARPGADSQSGWRACPRCRAVKWQPQEALGRLLSSGYNAIV